MRVLAADLPLQIDLMTREMDAPFRSIIRRLVKYAGARS